MKIVIIIVSMLSNLFMFSYFGTKLIEESAAVGTEIANLPWYNFKSRNVLRYLILIQLRSQKPQRYNSRETLLSSFRDICNV